MLLAFAATLLVAVMLSGVAHRSVLSTAVLFLIVGYAIGNGALGLVEVQPDESAVTILAELALFSVLFTDGMRAGMRDIRAAWHLPGRALLLGMPITLLLTALGARALLGYSWTVSFLVGAALSPTDPVFAAAIVGREDVPYRLRHLLNVESGLNDGIALPIVVVLIALAGGGGEGVSTVLLELVAGVALGIALPVAALWLERSSFLAPSIAYEPLNAFAIGLLVLAVSLVTRANAFLAAFAAGMTVASVGPAVRQAFARFGDLITELLKLAALMVFGVAVPFGILLHSSGAAYAFTALVLLVVRPIAIGLSLIGTKIDRREWIAAAWFGPKGFASVIYGLLILAGGITDGEEVFAVIALVITISIVAHSSTDILVARWLRVRDAS